MLTLFRSLTAGLHAWAFASIKDMHTLCGLVCSDHDHDHACEGRNENECTTVPTLALFFAYIYATHIWSSYQLFHATQCRAYRRPMAGDLRRCQAWERVSGDVHVWWHCDRAVPKRYLEP